MENASHGHVNDAKSTVQTLHVQPQYKLPPKSLSASDKFEGSSDLVNLRYHMGPVLSSPINIYLIWYGKWAASQKMLIKDFLLSISNFNPSSPSVAEWWRTVSLYTDQTGANISRSVLLAGSHRHRSPIKALPRRPQERHLPNLNLG
ncbi:unnamed protein product [Fraxinus pennsylvanica]|uniref:Uncharacterized protein n=1 Tax=Fraxinus pennsylvanica TaxID=56036 RepID=A0AAD1YSF2_9LAMI|nr:unnamed protein product [Fraxinus pennsylvanica]